MEDAARRDPTWSSPVGFVMADGTPVVYVAGTKSAAAYHATTGEELWKLGGFSEIVVPTPQVTPDSILLTSGYSPVQPIVSLSHAARGNLKMPEDRKATAPFHWAIMRGGPYMPTPIIYKGKLYICDDGGILSVHSVDDGKRILRKRVRNAEAIALLHRLWLGMDTYLLPRRTVRRLWFLWKGNALLWPKIRSERVS